VQLWLLIGPPTGQKCGPGEGTTGTRRWVLIPHRAAERNAEKMRTHQQAHTLVVQLYKSVGFNHGIAWMVVQFPQMFMVILQWHVNICKHAMSRVFSRRPGMVHSEFAGMHGSCTIFGSTQPIKHYCIAGSPITLTCSKKSLTPEMENTILLWLIMTPLGFPVLCTRQSAQQFEKVGMSARHCKCAQLCDTLAADQSTELSLYLYHPW